MYRKSLEMDPANDQAAEQPQRCVGDADNFLERVTQLPLVRSAVNTTLNAVKKAKESNGLVDYTLTNAINTALLAAEKAKPLVNKFEVPIGYVDVIACRTLDKLEEKAPIIFLTPEQIVSESKKIYQETVVKPALAQYNNIKNYGLGKVDAIKDYGVKTATDFAKTPYGHFVVDQVDVLLIKVDEYVDEYLPKTPGKFNSPEDEVEEEEEQEFDAKLDANIDTIKKELLFLENFVRDFIVMD